MSSYRFGRAVSGALVGAATLGIPAGFAAWAMPTTVSGAVWFGGIWAGGVVGTWVALRLGAASGAGTTALLFAVLVVPLGFFGWSPTMLFFVTEPVAIAVAAFFARALVTSFADLLARDATHS
jgi:hypothetical protein